ncbi:MAG: family 16 glycoside hydrolase [Oscillochloridaceae bacterium umkhey_bin13]
MSTSRRCPQCGSAAATDERVCASCGTRLDQPQAAAPAPLPIPTSTNQAASPLLPPRDGKRSLGMVIVSGVIALLGAGCMFVIVIFYLTQGPRPAQVEVGTAMVLVATESATSVAVPTAVGGGVLGGSTVGGAASVAQTAQAATAEAIATSTAEALLAEARLIFRDEFVDNRNAWFTGVFQEIETNLIEDGVFKVIWSADGTSYELYEPQSFTNFMAELDCQVARGGSDGSCGLIFGQQAGVGFLKYELFDDYYRLFVVTADQGPRTLAEGDPVALIRRGEVNRLRVIRQGEQLQLWLNDQPLADVRDETFPEGKIGISTSSYAEQGGVEIWFDNFAIWALP